jgi:hypothetical protein
MSAQGSKENRKMVRGVDLIESLPEADRTGGR